MSAPDPDLLSTWQFELPTELIASRPPAERDESRLLVVDRATQSIIHSSMRDLPNWLRTGDLLVFNNTRVLPARLFGFRTATGGRWEGLYIEQAADGHWLMMCETRGRLSPGESITVIPAREWNQAAETGFRSGYSKSLVLTLVARDAEGQWVVRPESSLTAVDLLEQFGCLPLPPYMGRKMADDDDSVRYQTTFAAEPGAVAAPTAGLHFNERLLSRCAEAGVQRSEVTLHVGPGTFRPVTSERLSEHCMHEEWCRLPQSCVTALTETRARKGRVIAVGTTCVRTLESAAIASHVFPAPWEGRTSLFIRPGFPFKAIDCLLTNFHLPGSTLLVLVSAMTGYELLMEAYRQAVSERYRFFSYGDAMLIL
ncbi:MAG: tRNA preQ1(34) S-adenosylmethionine ribosyltransferase-isomerase QueA [Planctomycetaceae bacterium]|nr:tRNA preQ1(34) S-adenosylmethionine ribosyltransferase-isomerase QueA [Planctomycetaceae bacterium]